MDKLKLIIKREFLAKVRNKSFIIMTFLSPLLMVGLGMLIVFLSQKNSEEVRTIAFVDTLTVDGAGLTYADSQKLYAELQAEFAHLKTKSARYKNIKKSPYFNALQIAAPARVKIFSYGKTWENRPLMYVAISNAVNIANLDSLSDNMKRLSDPRVTTQGEADEMIENMVGSTWLSYGVHGNAISPMEASMQTAYHLLAATNQPQVDTIMANSVVFIDPQQNPDGRDRFINKFREARGLEEDSSPLSAEHSEPWPSGRVNHYLFDLNRDWFVMTQPETQGKVAALQEYFPLVYIDLHEMGGNSSYYFAPSAPPDNPNIADNQWKSMTMIGRSNAKYFDQYGFDYFTREVFDAFYPGYGASWPAYYGGVSATYEQASSGGLLLHRNDGETLHYRDAVRHHLVTSLSTAEVSASNKEKLLKEFYE